MRNRAALLKKFGRKGASSVALMTTGFQRLIASCHGQQEDHRQIESNRASHASPVALPAGCSPHTASPQEGSALNVGRQHGQDVSLSWVDGRAWPEHRRTVGVSGGSNGHVSRLLTTVALLDYNIGER